jgi:hypothetical protein
MVWAWKFSFLHSRSHFPDLPPLREQPVDDTLRKTTYSRPDTRPLKKGSRLCVASLSMISLEATRRDGFEIGWHGS